MNLSENMRISFIEQILDLARWAPSGDNTQPWRFEIVGARPLLVHGFDTREHCVYDLDGRPSQISLGALLETISIAASMHGRQTTCQRRLDRPDAAPGFDLHFRPDAKVQADPLAAHIRQRSVQRRPMRTRALLPNEKQTLEASVGESHRILWLEGFAMRFQMARLMFNNAKLRLTMPEAYRVHRDIIQWNARFSEDRVPDQALGIDPMTARLMRFVMGSWRRVEFFNRFLAGTWMPRIQMDLIPGLACAGHFMIVAKDKPVTIDQYIDAGRAMQRFWLTATMLGLQLQPEMTPLIFARYVREGIQFSTARKMTERAADLDKQLSAIVGEEAARLGVFMGRIGAGPAASARSTRRKLKDLILSGSA